MRHLDTFSGTLTINSLSVMRGDKELVSGLDLVLKSGDMVWVKGSNGIGKTSLLKCVAGLLRPHTGQILWNGQPIVQQSGITAFQGHSDAHKLALSAQENLRFWQSVFDSKVSINTVMKRVDLWEQRKLEVKHFSAGQSRRLALARLLLSAAPLWILDEPAAAMDTLGQTLIQSLLSEHIERKGCVLLASHGAPDKIGSSTRILTLNRSDDERV